MSKKSAFVAICFALLQTLLIVGAWCLIRLGLASDKQMSALYIILSVVVILGIDTLTGILLAHKSFRGRNLLEILVFLILHTLFLVSLGTLEKVGMLQTAAGKTDTLKLFLIILIILLLDVIAVFLLFVLKREKNIAQAEVLPENSAAGNQSLLKTPEQAMCAAKALEDSLVKQIKTEQADPPGIAPPDDAHPQSPFTRLDHFEAELRDQTAESLMTSHEINIAQSVQTIAQDCSAVTQFDRTICEEQTVYEEPPHGAETVLEETTGTVYEEPPHGAETVLEEMTGTVYEEPPHGNEARFSERNRTVLDDTILENDSSYDPSADWNRTVLESTDNDSIGLLNAADQKGESQWSPRRKPSPLSKPAPGKAVLPDITQMTPPPGRPQDAGKNDHTDGVLLYHVDNMELRISLKEGETRLGSKAAKVDYVLPSPHISRLHAIFTRRGNQFFVRDMNSTNGTFLNGCEDPIPTETDTPIRHGDTITLADFTLHFYESGSPKTMK